MKAIRKATSLEDIRARDSSKSLVHKSASNPNLSTQISKPCVTDLHINVSDAEAGVTINKGFKVCGIHLINIAEQMFEADMFSGEDLRTKVPEVQGTKVFLETMVDETDSFGNTPVLWVI